MNISIALDPNRTKKLTELSAATEGNMTNVSVGGEHIEFEQSKLSRSKFARALLNSAIDRAHSQLTHIDHVHSIG